MEIKINSHPTGGWIVEVYHPDYEFNELFYSFQGVTEFLTKLRVEKKIY